MGSSMGRVARVLALAGALWPSCAAGGPGTAGGGDPLEEGFRSPPASARPWVYWFWLNGNITREGITADLEAMARVGIGGVLIMEVDQGAPLGPVSFMGSEWRELFRFAVAEAGRLGLEVNMNNDAGWNGSGGPWVKPEQAMQKVVWTETDLEGPRKFEGTLPKPRAVAGFYRDIAVLAFPSPGPYRIEKIRAKAACEVAHVPPAAPGPEPPAEMVIDRGRIVDVSVCMDGEGRFAWDVPAGRWTVMRFGHTCTGVQNHPSPASGRGLECDKLAREGAEANFEGMMAKLAADVGPAAGRALAATHVDSWENGSQNWTARMRDEFRKRRGYDPLTFLPVMSGRVVGSLEVSERFLWDLRRTVSELVIENYARRIRGLARARGLRFTIEAYGGPCDALPYGGEADEPMGEFWMGGGAMETCRGMASAAHVYGKPIAGAEAFTADNRERWKDHPATIKALGDRAFCEGINRFVFHRYAHQPWADRRPGMTMGPWGLHYERTQTWWDKTLAWHTYLARCQFLLRQGRYVADACYLQAEAPPQGFSRRHLPGRGWDECPSEVVLERMSVKDGRLMLPDGMSYRLLVLPSCDAMTPALLRKIRDLVREGATVVGPPPRRSPSLADYPACDDEVKRLAGKLWAECDGKAVREHRFGKGRVVWGVEPGELLLRDGVRPDFETRERLNWIHRATEEDDIYFVANPGAREVRASCAFRVAGKRPELWWPETGRVEQAALSVERDGVTRVSLTLGPSESVFVVFRRGPGPADPAVSLTWNGKVLASVAETAPKILVEKAVYGMVVDLRLPETGFPPYPLIEKRLGRGGNRESLYYTWRSVVCVSEIRDQRLPEGPARQGHRGHWATPWGGQAPSRTGAQDTLLALGVLVVRSDDPRPGDALGQRVGGPARPLRGTTRGSGPA